MAIIYRLVKGSELTHAELDNNFLELDEGKLNKALYSSNSALVIKDKDGALVVVPVAEQRMLGRLTGGNIQQMTAAEVKTFLTLAIADVNLLQAALDGKAASSHGHDIADVNLLQAALDDKAGLSLLNGLSVFAKGTNTLVAGTKAVSVALMLATDYVIVGVITPGGTQGALFTTGSEAGGFTCKSTDIGDTSTFFYIVLRP